MISRFEDYLKAFDERPPFCYEQLRIHRSVIEKRRALGSVEKALMDDRFLEDLHELLIKWGMAERGSKLVDLGSFKRNIRRRMDDICWFERFEISESPSIFDKRFVDKFTDLILGLEINENKAKVVIGFKTLHHLLPNLVPPIDREYAGRFFCWHRRYFQDRQPQIIQEGLMTFNKIAREVDLKRFVGEGWRTSPTKIIDNAIVGYCMVEKLPRPS